jgi:hypothetical protein
MKRAVAYGSSDIVPVFDLIGIRINIETITLGHRIQRDDMIIIPEWTLHY